MDLGWGVLRSLSLWCAALTLASDAMGDISLGHLGTTQDEAVPLASLQAEALDSGPQASPRPGHTCQLPSLRPRSGDHRPHCRHLFIRQTNLVEHQGSTKRDKHNAAMWQCPGLVGGLVRPLGGRVQARGRVHLRSRGMGDLEREECPALPRRRDTTHTANSLHQAPSQTLGASRCQGSWEFNAVFLVLGVRPVFVASYSKPDRNVKTFTLPLNTKTRNREKKIVHVLTVAARSRRVHSCTMRCLE